MPTIWANCIISLTGIKAIKGDHVPCQPSFQVRSQWRRYSLQCNHINPGRILSGRNIHHITWNMYQLETWEAYSWTSMYIMNVCKMCMYVQHGCMCMYVYRMYIYIYMHVMTMYEHTLITSWLFVVDGFPMGTWHLPAILWPFLHLLMCRSK